MPAYNCRVMRCIFQLDGVRMLPRSATLPRIQLRNCACCSRQTTRPRSRQFAAVDWSCSGMGRAGGRFNRASACAFPLSSSWALWLRVLVLERISSRDGMLFL